MNISDPGRRHVAFFDVHVPVNIDLKQAIDFSRDFRPDYFIVGGDFLNGQWVSHWNDGSFRRIGWDKLRDLVKEEFQAGQEVLSEIRKAMPKARIIYIPGNHEHWYADAAFKYPELQISVKCNLSKVRVRHDLELLKNRELKGIIERELRTEKFRIDVLEFNEPLKIGKLLYLHGHQFTGQRPTATSAARFPGVSLTFGHFHKHEVTPVFNQGDPRKCYEHVAVPCMTTHAHGYLKTQSTTWMQGFWLANFTSEGYFDGRVKKIIRGKLI